MPDLGKYAFHVLASYGATGLVILVVIIWSYLKHERARKTLLSVESSNPNFQNFEVRMGDDV